MLFGGVIGTNGYVHGGHRAFWLFLRFFMFGEQFEVFVFIKVFNFFLVLLVGITNQFIFVGFHKGRHDGAGIKGVIDFC